MPVGGDIVRPVAVTKTVIWVTTESPWTGPPGSLENSSFVPVHYLRYIMIEIKPGQETNTHR